MTERKSQPSLDLDWAVKMKGRTRFSPKVLRMKLERPAPTPVASQMIQRGLQLSARVTS